MLKVLQVEIVPNSPAPWILISLNLLSTVVKESPSKGRQALLTIENVGNISERWRRNLDGTDSGSARMYRFGIPYQQTADRIVLVDAVEQIEHLISAPHVGALKSRNTNPSLPNVFEQLEDKDDLRLDVGRINFLHAHGDLVHSSAQIRATS